MDNLILINIVYVIAAALFIFGLKLLGNPATARKGNMLSGLAMLVAIIVTLMDQNIVSYGWIMVSILAGSAVGVSKTLNLQVGALSHCFYHCFAMFYHSYNKNNLN